MPIDTIESESADLLVQDMTHCFIRAMSPIHIKCKILPLGDFVHLSKDTLIDLANMGVRASMSIVRQLLPIISLLNNIAYSRLLHLTNSGA